MCTECMPYVSPNGNIIWMDRMGRMHCLSGPAIVYSPVHKEYYRHGKLHRDDGPAIDKPNIQIYYCNNRLHRDGGEPAVIWANGRLEYWEHGKQHRVDLPAVIWPSGRLEYWEHGKRIRVIDPEENV